MAHHSSSSSWVLALLGLLSSCSLYVPMQSAAPAIRHKGEAEVAANWSLTNRVDGGLTYSPAPHLLVRGAGSVKLSLDNSNYVQCAQYEVGVGTYWPLGKSCLVGGLAGVGQASAQAEYDDDGNPKLHLFGSTPVAHQLDAAYSKRFGELNVAFLVGGRGSVGLAYRLVQLRLTNMSDHQVAVPSQNILRTEPMLFYRVRPGATQELYQLQLALGSSTTVGFRQSEAEAYADPARQLKLDRGYVSVGLLFYPRRKGKR